MKNSKTRARTRPGEVPQLLKSKRNNKTYAYVWIAGQKHFCGEFGTVEAESKRLRLWNEYLAGQKTQVPNESHSEVITIAILVDRFLTWAKSEYVKNGRSTGSYERFCYTVRPLLELYIDTPVEEFTPLSLKAVRNLMEESGSLSRKIINTRINLIRQIFKWGVENELVPINVLAALQAVSGLKRGRTTARDYRKILPVPDATVEKTLPLLSGIIADMVRLQRLIGCRPGDIVSMKLGDIYKTKEDLAEIGEFIDLKGTWVYIPHEHKTEHHEIDCLYFIGRKGQEILTAYLADCESPDDAVFSPQREKKLRNMLSRAKRQTKAQPSQVDRSKSSPKKQPGKHYQESSYRNAIQRAIKVYNKREQKSAESENREPKLLPIWFPNQLRHSKGTEARAIGGLEAAQAVLNHANAKTTEIYAERKIQTAIDIAVEVG